MSRRMWAGSLGMAISGASLASGQDLPPLNAPAEAPPAASPAPSPSPSPSPSPKPRPSPAPASALSTRRPSGFPSPPRTVVRTPAPAPAVPRFEPAGPSSLPEGPPPLDGPSEMPAADRPTARSPFAPGESTIPGGPPALTLEPGSADEVGPLDLDPLPGEKAIREGRIEPSPRPEAAKRPKRFGLFPFLNPPTARNRAATAPESSISVEPRTDPAADATLKRKLEDKVRQAVAGKARDIEVRVVDRNVYVRARVDRIWNRRSVRRTIEGLPALAGYRAGRSRRLTRVPFSSPGGPALAFATIQYYSHSLRKASAFNVIFPDSPDASRPWAVYYLLHGLSDDHTTWSRRSCVERYTLGYPLMVVMPDGGRGWFTNAQNGDAYEDDFLKDVVGMVEKNFPVRAERSGRAIGGLSMGGFGAVKLGLKHPGLFASVDSMSGVVGFLRRPFESKKLAPEFTRIFGRSPKDGPEDPFALASAVEPSRRPALRLVCGDEDPFLLQNRGFRGHLKGLDFPHEYEEHAGSHTWGFWDRHVRAAIDFHRRNLGIADSPEYALLR